jgi:hypothetical protein
MDYNIKCQNVARVVNFDMIFRWIATVEVDKK